MNWLSSQKQKVYHQFQSLTRSGTSLVHPSQKSLPSHTGWSPKVCFISRGEVWRTMACYTVLCQGNDSCFPMLQVPIQCCFLFLLFHFEAETATQHFDSRLLLVFVVNTVKSFRITVCRTTLKSAKVSLMKRKTCQNCLFHRISLCALQYHY